MPAKSPHVFILAVLTGLSEYVHLGARATEFISSSEARHLLLAVSDGATLIGLGLLIFHFLPKIARLILVVSETVSKTIDDAFAGAKRGLGVILSKLLERIQE